MCNVSVFILFAVTHEVIDSVNIAFNFLLSISILLISMMVNACNVFLKVQEHAAL